MGHKLSKYEYKFVDEMFKSSLPLFTHYNIHNALYLKKNNDKDTYVFCYMMSNKTRSSYDQLLFEIK